MHCDKTAVVSSKQWMLSFKSHQCSGTLSPGKGGLGGATSSSGRSFGVSVVSVGAGVSFAAFSFVTGESATLQV